MVKLSLSALSKEPFSTVDVNCPYISTFQGSCLGSFGPTLKFSVAQYVPTAKWPVLPRHEGRQKTGAGAPLIELASAFGSGSLTPKSYPFGQNISTSASGRLPSALPARNNPSTLLRSTSQFSFR